LPRGFTGQRPFAKRGPYLQGGFVDAEEERVEALEERGFGGHFPLILAPYLQARGFFGAADFRGAPPGSA
jgi:hypothetical protein